MSTYFAITQRNGRWEYLYSGQDPREVYQGAVDMLGAHGAYPDDERVALSPFAERLLDTLRVVPESVAQEVYHVVYSRERPTEV